MQIEKLFNIIGTKVLDFRAVERLIEQESFEVVWKTLNDVQKQELADLAIKGDICSLKREVRLLKNKLCELEQMSYEGLREKAKILHIPNYSRLCKEELIRSIKNDQGSTSGANKAPA